jgi:subtilisin family serine protease
VLRGVLALDADERNRTSTGLPPHGPEPCASTNSATSAWCLVADQCSAWSGWTYDSLPRRTRKYHRRIVRCLLAILLPALLAIPGVGLAAVPDQAAAPRIEVIVGLAPPPAARSGWRHADRAGRSARVALAAVEREQLTVSRRILSRIPGAEIRWRYRIVLAGLAVSLPAGELRRLEAVPGVARVYPSVRYGPLSRPEEARPGGPAAIRSREQVMPGVIGAPALWGPALEHAGQGMKIAILDDGVDQRHPFFDPTGLSMPPGFPKGDAAYTTAKVIVARAFAPRDAGWLHASKPFDPVHSYHGMHVAGIAAGAPDTPVGAGEAGGPTSISGVAPLAYIGNYKVLTVPTESGLGLNGNSPELVAAIEAAVADGMDVLNLSLGEPEVEPSRDAVAIALDNAAAAGVIPVASVGNDFDLLGRGSAASPGSSLRAITVGAADDDLTLASFSASGPTPLGLVLKPDVTAPGVDVLSAQPGGSFGTLSGTSMAAPHVAGGAALLLALHPGWTVAQVKSALVSTGRPVWADSTRSTEAEATRSGGGMIQLEQAADPLVFATPQSVALGLLDAHSPALASASVGLADAGGGTGAWTVTVETPSLRAGLELDVPSEVSVPGTLAIGAHVAADAPEGERTGFVVLTRGAERRRIPFWYRVTRPRLPEAPAVTLDGPGTYRGNAAQGAARVSTYRYPDGPSLVRQVLPGPEQVYRIVLPRAGANLGVSVIGTAPGVAIHPRIVLGADENRLAGASALPFVGNPYLTSFLAQSTSAAVLVPGPGTYSVVFDTASAARAGRFRFRLWIDDVRPPAVSLLSRTATRGRVRARVRDGGAGVDPESIQYRLDGGFWRSGSLAGDIATLPVAFARPGMHRLELRVSDRQEAKNNENVPRMLPNTRVVMATIRVPR